MKRAMMAVTLMVASGLILAFAGTADATTLFTEPGGTFTVDAGFPWVMPNTNFHYLITTNGTDGQSGVNAGDGTFNGNGGNLNITTWGNFNQSDATVISGSIAANDLHLANAASNGSWLTIGLLSKYDALHAADWYMSGMFNKGVFAGFQRYGTQYSAFAGDDAGPAGTSPVLNFDSTTALDYELSIDNLTNMVSLRLNNGAGWSPWVSHSFGLDSWFGSPGPGDNLSEAGLTVLMWGSDGSGTSSATFGPITVSSIPEPAAMSLLALGGLALIRRRRSA